MKRLYVLCEGPTEVQFVKQILSDHLLQRAIIVRGRDLGGVSKYSKVRKELNLLLRDTGSTVTRMIDLFRVPQDFSGRESSLEIEDPIRRAEFLEQNFSSDINLPHFVPNLQLHEFEALLLTDLSKLISFYSQRKRSLEELATKVEKEFRSPEHVNRTTPPSYLIGRAVPEYSKTVAGIQAVREIGLVGIRSKCRHFDSWITSLENL